MQRRGALLSRISIQRDELARIERDLRGPMSFADQGVALLSYLRGHPLLTAGIVAVLVVRRRTVLGLLKTAWRWRTGYRFIKSILRKLNGRALD
jgi:hypothetical protein